MKLYIYKMMALATLLLCFAFDKSHRLVVNSNPQNAYEKLAYVPPTSKKYALLIGINKYKSGNVNQLRGCVNDINIMKDLLLKRGFDEKNIVFLPDDKATKSAIVQSFNQLIDSAKKDDIVVIHYSGHGSQVRDRNGDEIDGWDETLVPYDYKETRESQIVDDSLNVYLNKLTVKTQNVTVILDACHSGGGTKDLSLYFARFVSPFETKIETLESIESFEKELAVGGSGFDNNSNYVLISGCRSDQKSHEYPFSPSQYYGILTRTLVNELSNKEGQQNWPDVIENVKSQVRGVFANQTPQLEGNKESFVFGERVWLNLQYLRASPGANGFIDVAGGAVQGITKGSIFKVYDPEVIEFKPNTPFIAEIEITEVGSTSSKAKIINNGSVTKRNSKARIFKKNFQNLTLNLIFKGDWLTNKMKALKSAITAIDAVKENTENPYLVLISTNNFIKITYASDTSMILNSFSKSDLNVTKNITSQIEVWRQWFSVLGIENPKPKLKIAVNLSATKDLDGAVQHLFKPDYEFKDGEKVLLSIKNLSDVPVYIYILDLQDDGTIDAYPLSKFINQSDNSNQPLQPKTEKAASFTTTVENGRQRTIDVMKVFATANPVEDDFNSLKQGPSQPSRQNIDELSKRINPPGKAGELDDYVTLEKVILIKK